LKQSLAECLKNNMQHKHISLINLSIDRKLFEEGSGVALRFKEYAKQYKEIHVVVHTSPGFQFKKLADNVWIYPTNSKTKLGYFMDARKIGSEIIHKIKKTDTPASIQITSQDAFTHVVAILLKRTYSIPIELQYHTDFMSPYFRAESLKNRLRYCLYKWSLKKADAIRVVSSRIKKSIEGIVSEIPVRIEPVAVDKGRFNVSDEGAVINIKNKYPQFSFIFLIMSRLEKEKNIALALRSFKQVCVKYPKAGLVIVGSGSELATLKKLARQLNINDNVVFEGWVNDPSVYYKIADAFVLTTNYEGYGMTLVEANAAGLPIITTDVGIVGDVLVEPQILVCNVGDQDCFERNMLSLVARNV